MRTLLAWVTAMALLGVCAPASAADDADNESVTVVGNVSYVSGGVGEDSRDRLNAFASAFNLKLLLAKKSGEYLGDVPVTIRDGSGKLLLEATADGPIFLANLPAGSYEVTASSEGATQRQKAAVVKGKLLTLHFRWP